MRTVKRYTPTMLSTFLLFSLACNLGSQPEPTEPVVEAKPPKEEKVVRKKRPQSASAAAQDTGDLEDADLIGAIRYAPKNPNPFEDLSVEVDVDKEGAFVDIDVEWFVNGRKLISQRFETLPHKYFEKDDRVQAVVTVSKNDATQTLEAKEIKIGNTPPRILTRPRTVSRLDGLRVRAEDPDGGPVTYHLKGEPPGLTIGEETGVMKYTPSKTAEGGQYNVVVIVRDDARAESEWRFQIGVSAGSESECVKAKRAERREAWEADKAAKKAAKEAAKTTDD